MDIYHDAIKNDVYVDGRFINAVIRCYGLARYIIKSIRKQGQSRRESLIHYLLFQCLSNTSFIRPDARFFVSWSVELVLYLPFESENVEPLD